ncbi:MAG: hypothetical protein J0H74_15340 [Chitinophagaceae bacterium]|nr:hypothetical protein [Chitinophagaceae bacterium]
MDTLTPDKQLLIYLAEAGIGQYRDISGFLNQHFASSATTSPAAWENLKNVTQFISTLVEHKFIRVDFSELSNEEYVGNGFFSTPIKAMILRDGMEYISKNKTETTGTHVQLNAENIHYTGNIGYSNRYSTQRSTSDKQKSDLPSKVKKWIAAAVALGVAIPTIIIAWNKLKTKPEQEKVVAPNVDSLKKKDSIHLRADLPKTIENKKLIKNHPDAVDALIPAKIEVNRYHYSVPLSNANINRLLNILPDRSVPVSVWYSDQDSLIAQKVLNWIIKRQFDAELHRNGQPVCGQMPPNSFAYRYISIQTESFLSIFINCL